MTSRTACRRTKTSALAFVAAVCAALLGTVPAASAQTLSAPTLAPEPSTAMAPVSPMDQPLPTPTPAYGDAIPGPPAAMLSMPPFTAPLPPAVVFPPWVTPVPGFPPPPGRPPMALPEQVPGALPPAGGLRQALAEYDRRAGLSWSGGLLRQASSLLQGENVWGTARVEVEVSRAGTIRAARILDTTSDREGWRRSLATLREGRAAPVRLPEGARGGWAILEVSAELRLPSGHRPGESAFFRDPGALLTFDVSDIGARPLRTVHARSLASTWF